jgi:hypothetical protein
VQRWRKRREVCSRQRASIHGNGHTRREEDNKDWAVGDSFPRLIPAESQPKARTRQLPSPSSSSTSPPERRCPSPTVTTPTRRPSTASKASSPSRSKDAQSKSAPATRSASLDIPLGAVHRFDNLHPATSKTLAIVTPGILGPDYFREIAAIAKAAATSVPPTPPDPKALAEVMRRHGLTPAP